MPVIKGTRPHRINMDGKSITETRRTAAALLPGSLALINAAGFFAQYGVDGKRAGRQLFIINVDYSSGQRAADAVAAGDSAVGDYVEEGREFAALVAGGTVLSFNSPLTPNATGGLRLGVVGTDEIIAYSQEAYTVPAGAAQLVLVRVA